VNKAACLFGYCSFRLFRADTFSSTFVFNRLIKNPAIVMEHLCCIKMKVITARTVPTVVMTYTIILKTVPADDKIDCATFMTNRKIIMEHCVSSMKACVIKKMNLEKS